jgi:Flp pilus assembly pilin Flp
MGIKRASNGDQEKGAALVEFALLATLLFMLIFGSITAGISFSRSNALQTAAREGSRFAATFPGGSSSAGDGWFDTIIDTTVSAGLGDLNNGVPGRTICVAFIDASGIKSRILDASNGRTNGTAECIAGGDGLSDTRVQVTAARETQIQAVIYAIDITVSGDAVARYER